MVVFLLNKRQLTIYCNASAELGLGHWMRCLSIARAFSITDWNITFCSVETTPAALDMLVEFGIEHKNLSQTRRDAAPLLVELMTLKDTDLEQAVVNVGSLLAGNTSASMLNNKDILLLDDYALNQTQWNELERFVLDYAHPDCLERIFESIPQIVLLNDDTEHSIGFQSPWVKWVINPAPNVIPDDYVQHFPAAQALLGPTFTYLRPEFGMVKYMPVCQRSSILIMLGGSDVKNLSAGLVLSLVAILPDTPITLVLGAATMWDEALSQLIAEQFPQVTIYQNPPNIPELMMQSGLAITTAGGTLGELAALGVPTLALVITDNQVAALANEHVGKWYEAFDLRDCSVKDYTQSQRVPIKTGISLSCRVAIKDIPADVTQAVYSLWYNLCRRKEMSAYARQLIDTQGCDRIMLNIGQQ